MQQPAQFSAVARAPIVRLIEGQSVSFPLLTAEELAELGEVVRGQWWDRAKKNPAGAKFTEVQWFRIRQELDEAVISTPEIIRKIGSIDGSNWCITRSLTKAGYPADQIEAIMLELAVGELRDLAELVSRVRFMPREDPKPDANDPVNRPLAGGGDATATQSPAPTPTGPQSPSSSPNGGSIGEDAASTISTT